MLECAQTPKGHFREVQNVSHHSLKCLLRPLPVASFQPRPQGFSLKKMGGPNQFFKGKALGTRLASSFLSVCTFSKRFCIKVACILWSVVRSCECRIIYKTLKHRKWIKISLFKQKQYLSEKKFLHNSDWKKNHASWKFPTPPPSLF